MKGQYRQEKEITKIGDLFSKYQNILKPPQRTVINEVVEVITDISGLTLTPTQVDYQVSTGTIFFKVPSALKTELRFYEEELKIHLQARLGLKNSPKLFL